MYDLQSFGLSEMIESGRELRRLGQNARTMEAAAAEIVDHFHDRFLDLQGLPNFVLVRGFKTHPFGKLPSDLVAAATTQAGSLPATTPCLCLLASRGAEPHWNGRAGSEGHRAIPLSGAAVANAPMIARLFHQMGVAVNADLSGGDLLMVDEDGQTFNVFHVEHALGSEYVPAQESFIRPYNVRSVVGFGGALPSNELFAFVLFSRVLISAETAELFRTLSLGAKLVLLPFAGGEIFA